MRGKIKCLLRLFCFEWKKQFMKLSIWIALLLLTIISFAQLKSIFETQSLLSPEYTDAKWKSLYHTLYSDFSGTITNEKIARLMNIYRPLEQKTADLTASTRTDDPTTYTGNVYSDRLFFKWCFVAPMEYAYLYQSYAGGIAADARENVTLYRSVGNQYEAEKNAQLANLFDGRRIDAFVYTEPYHFLFSYDFSAVFLLMLVLYSLCSVFVFEKEAGMHHLLPTVYHGGCGTVAAKLLSGFVFTAVTGVWFFLSDIAGILCSFGTLAGGDSPLYALAAFENTPLRCTLWQYLFLTALLRLLGVWAIGLMVLAVSRLFQTTLLPLSLGTAATTVLFYLYQTFSGSAHLWIRIVNPFSLIYSREIFAKAEFVELFGQPVPLALAAIVFTLLWTVGLTVVLLCPHGKELRHPKRRGSDETALGGS